jgi:3-deoxy-D-arabino-heptulosonate 7-phosphate (DAHP) synthase
MRIGLLVLGGGSWENPSFSTDDQARFSSLEKQKISRLILAMRIYPTVG